MASPQIADEVVSSDEFTLLNTVVSDATNIIYESEAWAKGTRSGQPVFSEETFTWGYQSEVILSIAVSKNVFLEGAGSEPGVTRTYTFEYRKSGDSGSWWVTCEAISGTTVTKDNAEPISDLSVYGISYVLPEQVDRPNFNDTITVFIQEPDPTYQNNSKYYSEQAAESWRELEELTVTSYAIDPVSTGTSMDVEKTKIDGVWNFNFQIPRGDTGNVYFMTFDVETEGGENEGELIMYKPEEMLSGVDFEIISSGYNEGCLGVTIE